MHKNSHCDNFARPPISSIRLRALSWLSDVGCPGHASGSAMSTMDPSRLATKSQLPSTEPPQFTTKPLLSHGGSPRGRHDRPRNRGVRTEQPAVRHAVVAGPSSSRHGAAGPATRSPLSATEPQRTARSRHASHGAEWNELLGCAVLWPAGPDAQKKWATPECQAWPQSIFRLMFRYCPVAALRYPRATQPILAERR